MATTVVVLILAIALVQGWPAWNTSDDMPLFRDAPRERIQIRDIQPTSQSREKTPAPPAPLPPVVVPNDVLVTSELDFGEAQLRVKRPEDDQLIQEGGDQPVASRQPDTGARLLKNVQPTYPAAARQEEVRARIQVEVKISERGLVQDATIRKCWRLFSDGSSRPVETLGYGLEEAALTAAQHSIFRPAQARGQPVSTWKVMTFTFGSD